MAHEEPRFLGYPDARPAFQQQYPGFMEDCAPLVRCSERIMVRKAPDEHQSAVYSQLAFAWEIFASIATLVSTGFPMAAIALGRTLMGCTMGAIYLADHPEKLEDFTSEAEYVNLKIMTNLHGDTMDETQRERYQELKDRFGNRGWYGMSVAQLATSVGLQSAYETFYREACTITHASALPLLTPQYGVGRLDIEATEEAADGRDYGSMALVYAAHLIFSLFERMNLRFELGNDAELKQFSESCARRGWFVASPAE